MTIPGRGSEEALWLPPTLTYGTTACFVLWARWQSMEVDADDITLRQAVAAQSASRFDARDRLYKEGRPEWHQFVDDAVKRLADQKAASRQTPRATKAEGPKHPNRPFPRCG